ncbi:MAG: exopolysaccharide biosynthesis polyprenyl glycosylphosphotransferase [Alphaproteobacteria bacterium]|nr:exopolysaccharide biosynthesis polyprenyl glycosylphosphotransferase [Alphaproteobacteria bacterium]
MAAQVAAGPHALSRRATALVVMLTDATAVGLVSVGFGIAGSLADGTPMAREVAALSLLGLSLIGLMRLFGAYQFAVLIAPLRRLAALAGAMSFIAVGTVLAGHFAAVDATLARLVGPWAVAVSLVSIAAFAATDHVIDRLRDRGRYAPRVVIVGATAIAERLILETRAAARAPFEIVGIFDDRTSRIEDSLADLPVLGTTEDLLKFEAIDAIDWIVVALPWSAEQRMAGLLDRLRTVSTRILLAPDMVGLRPGDGEGGIGEGPTLIEVLGRPMDGGRRLLKEIEDRVLGLALALLLLPVMAAIAAAVRLDSPGPALFRQRRIGYGGKAFDVLKFRTLRTDMQDAVAARQVAEKDPRVTTLGWILRKYSLDELPQLFNVVRGEMSLVGPRPYATGMMAGNTFAQDILMEYARRRRIKPGMTGWSQVNGGHGPIVNEQDLRRRLEYDLDYINNWSPWFDFLILCMTVGVVAKGRRLQSPSFLAPLAMQQLSRASGADHHRAA